MKLFITIMIISLLTFGWFANDIYRDITNKRILDGIWIKNVNSTNAEEIALSKDVLGDFICINIKGMSYKRAVETCQHETFHEIWAECGESNNLTYCINKHEEVANGLE